MLSLSVVLKSSLQVRKVCLAVLLPVFDQHMWNRRERQFMNYLKVIVYLAESFGLEENVKVDVDPQIPRSTP